MREDGDFRLIRSLAIIESLDETPPGPKLLPGDATLRAAVRTFARVFACDIHPLQNLRVLDHPRAEFGADEAALDRWCRRRIGEGLAVCEALPAFAAAHPGSRPDRTP